MSLIGFMINGMLIGYLASVAYGTRLAPIFVAVGVMTVANILIMAGN